MKWEMEIEVIEAVLENIWDLHDKLSDAFTRFPDLTTSIPSIPLENQPRKRASNNNDSIADENNNRRTGFVFVKDDDDSAVQQAKSLNAVRTALENLEVQLEFFQIVQMQQRAETDADAAVAFSNKAGLFLQLRLAEHQGKKYGVIEEALAFVGGRT